MYKIKFKKCKDCIFTDGRKRKLSETKMYIKQDIYVPAICMLPLSILRPLISLLVITKLIQAYHH